MSTYQDIHRAIEIIDPPDWDDVVSVQLASDHFQISSDDDTALVENLYIPAACEFIEDQCNIAIATQTQRMTLNCFPDCNYILLPNPPLQSVTSIQYVDANGDTQTWASSNYDVDTRSHFGRIVLLTSFPSFNTNVANPITITFVAGYTNLNRPKKLQLSICRLARADYENRDFMGLDSAELEMAKQREIAPYKTVEFY